MHTNRLFIKLRLVWPALSHPCIETKKWLRTLLCGAVLFGLGAGVASAQQVLRVPQDVGDLGQAMQQIQNDGIIEMAAGTYNSPGATGFRARFVGKNFTIRAASGATVRLSGNGNSSIFFLEDSSTNRVITFENLIFENAQNSTEAVGGAVTILSASAVFDSCTFRNNALGTPTTGGAGIRVDNGSVTIRDSVFENNTAPTRGGAVALIESAADIQRTLFTGNRVNIPGHVSTAVGGAIFALNSSARIEGSRFEGNRAAFTGGALNGFGVWQDPVTTPRTLYTIINSTFIDNIVEPDPCCPVNGNLTVGGAIQLEDQSRADIQGSRFIKNRANWGGAISTFRAEVLIADSVFRGNSGELDGALPPLGGTLAMTSADRNNASTEGGTINRPTGRLQITDTLIQGRFEDVGATGALGGCLFAEGDINRVLGQGGVAQDGTEASNRMPVDISRSIFADCDVAQPTANGSVAGGGMALSVVDLNLTDSVIFDSDTPTSGGGLAILPHSVADITGTTFADNSAQRGGAIHLAGSELNVTDGQFFRNSSDLPAGGAAIFSIPVGSRDKDALGTVANSLFADHDNLPIVDADFTDGPINDLRYNGNRFVVASAADDVYQNTIDFVRSSPSELNSRVITRNNGTSTPKSQVDNQALTNSPAAGAVVAGPSIVQSRGAVGDAAGATSAFLGHAWSGGSATLAGQNLATQRGLVEVDAAGAYALRVDNTSVSSTTVEEQDAGGNCLGAASGLCLNGDRFLVEVNWRDFEGNVGEGIAVPAPSIDSGLFFFFNADNWEVLVKVLFGCPINNHFWVFAAATTNVEYTLTVTDTLTGDQVTYFNPLGNNAAAVTDIRAFETCDVGTNAPRAPGPMSRPAIRLDAPPEGVEVIGGAANRPDVEARLAANSTPIPVEESGSSAEDVPSGVGATCVANTDELFLNDNRFRVEITWEDFEGNVGDGLVVPFCAADSGLFFFFNPDNWEVLVKVLFGCPINNRYWVFAAATTNVEYTLTVTDTQTNEVKTYFNPLGNAADAVTDTQAFATCP